MERTIKEREQYLNKTINEIHEAVLNTTISFDEELDKHLLWLKEIVPDTLKSCESNSLQTPISNKKERERLQSLPNAALGTPYQFVRGLTVASTPSRRYFGGFATQSMENRMRSNTTSSIPPQSVLRRSERLSNLNGDIEFKVPAALPISSSSRYSSSHPPLPPSDNENVKIEPIRTSKRKQAHPPPPATRSSKRQKERISMNHPENANEESTSFTSRTLRSIQENERDEELRKQINCIVEEKEEKDTKVKKISEQDRIELEDIIEDQKITSADKKELVRREAEERKKLEIAQQLAREKRAEEEKQLEERRLEDLRKLKEIQEQKRLEEIEQEKIEQRRIIEEKKRIEEEKRAEELRRREEKKKVEQDRLLEEERRLEAERVEFQRRKEEEEKAEAIRKEREEEQRRLDEEQRILEEEELQREAEAHQQRLRVYTNMLSELKDKQEKRKQAELEKIERENKKREQENKKREQEEKQKRLEAERTRYLAQKKLMDEEKKKLEMEEKRLQQEEIQRRQEEEERQRKAEEQRKEKEFQEMEERKAEEQRQLKIASDNRKMEEEKRAREEEEQRKQDEARKQIELKKAAAKAKKLEDERKQAEEEKLRIELEKNKIEEEKKRREEKEHSELQKRLEEEARKQREDEEALQAMVDESQFESDFDGETNQSMDVDDEEEGYQPPSKKKRDNSGASIVTSSGSNSADTSCAPSTCVSPIHKDFSLDIPISNSPLLKDPRKDRVKKPQRNPKTKDDKQPTETEKRRIRAEEKRKELEMKYTTSLKEKQEKREQQEKQALQLQKDRKERAAEDLHKKNEEKKKIKEQQDKEQSEQAKKRKALIEEKEKKLKEAIMQKEAEMKKDAALNEAKRKKEEENLLEERKAKQIKPIEKPVESKSIMEYLSSVLPIWSKTKEDKENSIPEDHNKRSVLKNSNTNATASPLKTTLDHILHSSSQSSEIIIKSKFAQAAPTFTKNISTNSNKTLTEEQLMPPPVTSPIRFINKQNASILFQTPPKSKNTYNNSIVELLRSFISSVQRAPTQPALNIIAKEYLSKLEATMTKEEWYFFQAKVFTLGWKPAKSGKESEGFVGKFTKEEIAKGLTDFMEDRHSSSSASVLSPIKIRESESYEISDYHPSDESESETDSDDDKVKKIPSWAQGDRLQHSLIKQQFMDPDIIFPSVNSCELEDIFDSLDSTNNKRNRKKRDLDKRTSSGNWTHDGYTLQDKQYYRERMGYNKN